MQKKSFCTFHRCANCSVDFSANDYCSAQNEQNFSHIMMSTSYNSMR